MENNEQFIISLDQGTTSSRAVIFDAGAKIREVVQKEFKQIYPKAGWVEHDPMEIFASQYAVLIEAIAKSGIRPQQIAAMSHSRAPLVPLSLSLSQATSVMSETACAPM